MLQPLHKISSRLQAGILKGHTWIFLSIILLFSFVLVAERENIVGLGNYLSLVLGISLIYSPILWFVTVRSELKNRLNRWAYRLLWAFLFCAYPILLFPTGITLNDLAVFFPAPAAPP